MYLGANPVFPFDEVLDVATRESGLVGPIIRDNLVLSLIPGIGAEEWNVQTIRVYDMG